MKRTGTALVTGASAGIGAAFARELAARGHALVLVARDAARLEAMVEPLEALGAARVEVLPADLSQMPDVERVAARLTDPTRPVDLLVNNAGFGLSTPFLETDLADELRALDVMCRAVLVTSHAAGRAMRERGRGAIVNVSSIAAFAPVGTYSAVKSWVRFFTEGLAMELAGTGVTATALCPGFVRTEFHERGSFTTDGIPGALWLDADHLVRECLADVDRGAVVSIPSVQYKVAAASAHAAPMSLVRRVARVARERAFR